jgi:uncharacterized Rmd1/YagE family protein
MLVSINAFFIYEAKHIALRNISFKKYLYYQSFYQKMLDTLKVRDYGKLVQEKIDSLQDLYSTARELSTEQVALLLEVVIVLLILWEVIRPIIELL